MTTEMPYETIGDVPEHVRKHGDEAARKWLSVWNSVFEETGSEEKAFAAANATLPKSGGEVATIGEVRTHVEAFPETFSGDKVSIQIFKTGKWKHPVYGDLEVTLADLERMVHNYERTERALVVDYDHGTDIGKTPEDRKAAGWIRELRVERYSDKDGGALFAVVELTPKAAEYVRNGEYRLFSPTWTPSLKDKESGEDIGITLLRGALTNSPYIDGMHPAVPLSERAAKVLDEIEKTNKVDDTNTKEEPAEPTLVGYIEAELIASEPVYTKAEL